MSTAVLLPISFFVLLAGALLFTNAIEWLGVRLSLAQGVNLEVHFPTLERDLAFFVGCFGAAFVLGVVGAPLWLRIVAAIALVLAYAVYVRLTLAGSGAVDDAEELAPLIMDRTRHDPPETITVIVQCVIALGAIVGGAHLFVEQITEASKSLGIEPLLLSLVIAPFATELPEKANSVFWMRDAKDTLALGNITGAMVFQSTLPVAFGMAFTDWDFADASIIASALALAGGALAIFELQFRRRFHPRAIVAWALLFAAFVLYVAAVA